MYSILLKTLESILGRALDPALRRMLQERAEQERRHLAHQIAQAQLQSRQIFMAPRQAGKSQAILELTGCPPPGTVQYIPPQQSPQLTPHEAALRYLQALGVYEEPVPKPENTVMEFSLEE